MNRLRMFTAIVIVIIGFGIAGCALRESDNEIQSDNQNTSPNLNNQDSAQPTANDTLPTLLPSGTDTSPDNTLEGGAMLEPAVLP